MKEVFLFIFVLVSFNAFTQSACNAVIIGDRISITYAQSYLESLRKKTASSDGTTLPSITDTFQLVDICMIDSVTIVELKKTQINNASNDTISFIPNSYYLLSKIDTIPSGRERLEVGKYYYLTITPYYPRNYFVSLGSPGVPIILNNTAYKIWFVGNVYYSRDILGVYIINSTKVVGDSSSREQWRKSCHNGTNENDK